MNKKKQYVKYLASVNMCQYMKLETRTSDIAESYGNNGFMTTGSKNVLRGTK